MNCRICAAECPPGAKLCRDCAAARRRAFAATVTTPLLAAAGVASVSSPRFAPKPRRRSGPRPSQRPGQPLPLTSVRRGRKPVADSHDPRSRRMRVAAAVGALVVVAAIAFLEFRTFAGGYGRSSAAQAPNELPAAEAPRMSAPAIQWMPPAPARSEVASAAEEAAASSAARSAGDAGNASETPPQAVLPKPAARKRAPPADAFKSRPAASAPTPVAETPTQVAAAPARRVEATRSDPLQNFSAALARCAREGLMARLGCEQRVRMQYCADSWGQTPQCAIGPATDHGQ